MRTIGSTVGRSPPGDRRPGWRSRLGQAVVSAGEGLLDDVAQEGPGTRVRRRSRRAGEDAFELLEDVVGFGMGRGRVAGADRRMHGPACPPMLEPRRPVPREVEREMLAGCQGSVEEPSCHTVSRASTVSYAAVTCREESRVQGCCEAKSHAVSSRGSQSCPSNARAVAVLLFRPFPSGQEAAPAAQAAPQPTAAAPATPPPPSPRPSGSSSIPGTGPGRGEAGQGRERVLRLGAAADGDRSHGGDAGGGRRGAQGRRGQGRGPRGAKGAVVGVADERHVGDEGASMRRRRGGGRCGGGGQGTPGPEEGREAGRGAGQQADADQGGRRRRTRSRRPGAPASRGAATASSE